MIWRWLREFLGIARKKRRRKAKVTPVEYPPDDPSLRQT